MEDKIEEDGKHRVVNWLVAIFTLQPYNIPQKDAIKIAEYFYQHIQYIKYFESFRCEINTLKKDSEKNMLAAMKFLVGSGETVKNIV